MMGVIRELSPEDGAPEDIDDGEYGTLRGQPRCIHVGQNLEERRSCEMGEGLWSVCMCVFL